MTTPRTKHENYSILSYFPQTTVWSNYLVEKLSLVHPLDIVKHWLQHAGAGAGADLSETQLSTCQAELQLMQYVVLYVDIGLTIKSLETNKSYTGMGLSTGMLTWCWVKARNVLSVIRPAEWWSDVTQRSSTSAQTGCSSDLPLPPSRAAGPVPGSDRQPEVGHVP